MSGNSPELGVETRVLFDGDVYAVQGFEGPVVRLRATNGKVALVALRELVGATDFEVLDWEGGNVDWSAAEFDTLPKAIQEAARELATHLDEAITGYRSGSSAAPEPGEPRPAYDPDAADLTVRMERKRAELGIGSSTLWKYKKQYEAQSLLGLVDHRRIKHLSPLGRTDPRVLEAMLSVQKDLVDGSNVSRKRLRFLVERRLSKEHGPGVVKMPSESTFYRVLKRLEKGKATFGAAKARRSIANLPDTPYRRLRASRPGEVVLIDSTPSTFTRSIRCVGGSRWSSL